MDAPNETDRIVEMKSLLLVLLLLFGCAMTGPPPAELTPEEKANRIDEILELNKIAEQIEVRYQDHNQVEGITFVSVGDSYGTDTDNALFTGMYLAAASYRYGVDPSPENLKPVADAVRGIYLLTHVSPVPGVLARWAFPLDRARAEIGYDRVFSLATNNGWADAIRSGMMYERDGYAYYTHTTKDQLTGIVFGLTTAFVIVNDDFVNAEIQEITSALINRLNATDWSLEDHKGRTPRSAYRVDLPLRLALESLDHAISKRGGDLPRSHIFFDFMEVATITYNRFVTRDFVWNLRSMNAHSLLLLRQYHQDAKGVERWEQRIWLFVGQDGSPHHEALHFAWTGSPMSDEAWQNLMRRATQPYYKFYSWEAPRQNWWHEPRESQGPGIDVLLPFHMTQYYTK